MKVKTIIEKLSKFNPEAEVRLNNYNGEEALFINARLNDNGIVWLDGENEINMTEEIRSRYKYAAKNKISDIDFYKDLLETGITVDMVRRYISDSVAYVMEQFCIEYGLL